MTGLTAPEASDVLRSAVSFLFVPGDRPERFAKAAAAGADVVVIDLEDAVAEGRRDSARKAVAEYLAARGRACVRVNPVTSPHHHRDLEALTDLPGLLAVMLAKADTRSSAASVAGLTDVPVIPLIESAEGVAHAYELAATAGVVRLAFGHLDYALDIGAEPTGSAMLHARSTLVHASRLAGLPGPIDGVTTALDDEQALADDLRCAQEVGLAGKLLIHPRQVAGAHAAFRPSAESLDWARSVLAAVGEGEAVRVDGHMVDAPVLARAEAILHRAGRDGQ
ncbi:MULTISPECIES: CoA ester lyase [unclassified Streptomyces]|uniref:HpcH/HpaI aldolase/citrate lyase family protein n=1 Tax=unclassified Streptomyces TaxID=2593676 RepID=UPI00225AF3EC|nr:MULTISPECIES: CoA ester lyase [unclassified Streptomyces]MCX4642008.1 CoA ester lyase [Streptomyces sp. NBC_01446]MCX5085740.1 CoA ester lyase [Streptomyces sp. NBC_00401]MCX5326881.1 CoA ester lyase [Streptomyces sp. NBC_00120]